MSEVTLWQALAAGAGAALGYALGKAVRAALEARNEQIRRLGVLKAHIANELKTLAKLGKGSAPK